MQVEALANSLHMRFFAPRIENEPEPWTMRNIYNSWTYHVQYWKNGSDEKVSAVNHAHCSWQLPVLCSAGAWLEVMMMEKSFARWQHLMVQRLSGLVLWAPEATHSGGDWYVWSHFPGFKGRLPGWSGAGEQAFLSPEGNCWRRPSWLSSWLGELGVTRIGWPVNDYCFMAWGPTYTTE